MAEQGAEEAFQSIPAIVLAAGLSSRMGRQKVLIEINGVPLVQRIVDQIQEGGLKNIILIFSDHSRALMELTWRMRIRFVENKRPETGMLESVRLGIRTIIRENPPALLVVLGDQPVLPKGLIGSMVQTHLRRPTDILVPCYKGKRGHPILIPNHFYESVLSNYDDQGLRGLLIDHPGHIREIEASNGEILRDLDTPEDLSNYAKSLPPPSPPPESPDSNHFRSQN